MILLVDADSLIFASCYRKRETPDDEHTTQHRMRQSLKQYALSIIEENTIDKIML